jgi:hypothetical protein
MQYKVLYSLACLQSAYASSSVSLSLQEGGPEMLAHLTLDAAVLSQLSNHGCWCSRWTQTFDKEETNVLDDLDALCRRWWRYRNCVEASCARDNDFGVYVVDDQDCSGNAGCMENVCKTDFNMAAEIMAHINTHSFSTATVVTDRNSECKPATPIVGSGACMGGLAAPSTVPDVATVDASASLIWAAPRTLDSNDGNRMNEKWWGPMPVQVSYRWSFTLNVNDFGDSSKFRNIFYYGHSGNQVQLPGIYFEPNHVNKLRVQTKCWNNSLFYKARVVTGWQLNTDYNFVLEVVQYSTCTGCRNANLKIWSNGDLILDSDDFCTQHPNAGDDRYFVHNWIYNQWTTYGYTMANVKYEVIN